MTPQIQTPVPHEQHGRTPHKKLPLLKEQAVKRLLAEGVKQAAICDQLMLSKSAVARIVAELKGRQGEVPMTTRCNGYASCRCVRCGAEKVRTREYLLRLHQSDEYERLKAWADVQPSEARNALDAKLGPLEAMLVSARKLP